MAVISIEIILTLVQSQADGYDVDFEIYSHQNDQIPNRKQNENSDLNTISAISRSSSVRKSLASSILLLLEYIRLEYNIRIIFLVW